MGLFTDSADVMVLEGQYMHSYVWDCVFAQCFINRAGTNSDCLLRICSLYRYAVPDGNGGADRLASFRNHLHNCICMGKET